MPVLTQAETNALVGLLQADLNAAQFATILAGKLDKAPERYTQSSDFQSQLTATFAAAESEGWMVNLLAVISVSLGDDLQAGRSAADLLYQHQGGMGLQTLLKMSDLYEPVLFARKLLLVTGHVCLLEIDGNAAGTGLLVGRDQVLTAYHVVATLLADGKPIAGSAPRLRCRFDFAMQQNPDGSRQALDGTIAAVVDDWLGPNSPPHEEELAGVAPSDTVTVGQLDYALVTLAVRAGDTLGLDQKPRGWTALARPPKALRRFAWIRVIQHPFGAPVKAADGHVTAIFANGARLRYYVSTTQGSSGAPCWNFDFDLIAIHNFGGVQTPTGKENAGIPITQIIDDIKGRFEDYAIPPPPTPGGGEPPPTVALAAGKQVWSVGAGYPVLNRVTFQNTLLQMLPAGAAQVLRVRGSRYSGRTFSLRIAQRYLAQLGHTIVTLSAISMNDATPETFVGEICGRLSLRPVQLPAGADLSTRASLAQRHLLTTFLAQLREAFPDVTAERKQVWICIDALDQAPLTNEIHELLAALAQRIGELPALRLVLIGYEHELPYDVDPLLTEENIAPVTVGDVDDYIRYLCEHVSRPITADKSLQLAQEIISSAPTDPPRRLRAIAQKVQEISGRLQQKREHDFG